MRSTVVAIAGLVMTVVLALVVTGLSMQAGIGCTSCHAMEPYGAVHADGPHATLGCDECHVDDRFGTLLADGLRGAGWAVAALGGVRPAPARVDDTVCRACHASTLEDLVVSRGIAVRHADFLAQPCVDCHSGSAHAVADRFYRTLEMDDCMGCHTSAATDTGSCDVCHVGDADRREGDTTWRATHGPDWETTHGMGDIETCTACHPPKDCIECHGTLIPHPGNWPIEHSDAAAGAPGERCVTCHDPGWCADCHGIEMPHPDGFMPQHGRIADESDAAVCATCHEPMACEACHVAAGHPDGPNVPTGHGE